MPKVLVYYVSVGGDKYYQQTRLAIKSLRTFGTYRGEVLVITDQPAMFSDVRTLPIEHLMPPRAEGVQAGVYAQCAKPMIAKANPPISGYYDFILYIDSDTLVASPRFGQLIDGMAMVGGLWVQQNFWSPVAFVKQVNTGGELDPATFRMCPNLSVCSGIVGFGHDVLHILDRWKQFAEQRKFAYDDQALLHAACASYNEGRIHYIPEHDVWFPTNRVQSPSIYHFTHQGRAEQEEMTARMFPT